MNRTHIETFIWLAALLAHSSFVRRVPYVDLGPSLWVYQAPLVISAAAIPFLMRNARGRRSVRRTAVAAAALVALKVWLGGSLLNLIVIIMVHLSPWLIALALIVGVLGNHMVNPHPAMQAKSGRARHAADDEAGAPARPAVDWSLTRPIGPS